ncbi:hypothetical protein N9A72_00435 [bacterium]|nr:hypothetical protein [bacterium]
MTKGKMNMEKSNQRNRDIENTEPEIEFGELSPESKEYMAAEELKKKNSYFGKLPHWIVNTGVLEVLRPKAVKLLAVLIRYADFTTQNGRVGNKKISKEYDIKGVSGYFKDLISLGVIKTWRNGWVRYYQIQNSPPPEIERKVEFYRKLDMYPKNTDTYPRDPKTGRFIKKDKLPKNSDMAYPKNTGVA